MMKKTIANEMRPKIRYWVPAAAMDQEDLKKEIHLLHDRGFGGVEVVTLMSTPDEILQGEDGWGSRHWQEMVQVIADTTKELGMTMDLANGPMWPISMPTIEHADDPGALCELTFSVTEVPEGKCSGKLNPRRTIHEEGTPKLLHVFAYYETADHVLVQDSYVDLQTSTVEENGELVVHTKLPKMNREGRWLIFAFFQQPAVHMTANGKYYVVDHMSREGAKACEKYWDQIFETCDYPSMESFFCDSLEYQVMMDWTPGLDQYFEEVYGYSILPYLPVIGLKIFYPMNDVPEYRFEDAEISDMINRDYFEILTRCYCENHLAVLEKMAEKYGKSIRYQTAYNKPFEGERCPLFVEIPENEALGRPAFDYQKTMASAAHLGRKKRYSFECAAEFGNSYGQSFEDLLWWVKRSLMSGMNAQVMHGGSYSGGYHGKYSENGHMKGVQWPGYDGFFKAISNEWNRTISIEDEKHVMDAIARMNEIFRHTAKVDCAIYRQTYENDGLGSEFCFYEDDGALMNRGYSYETISPYLLDLPVCKVTEGRLDANGVAYRCLIIPQVHHVDTGFLMKVKELLAADFPVLWAGNKPEKPEHYVNWNTKEAKAKWNALLDDIWNADKLIHVSDLQEIPDMLEKIGVLPAVKLEGKKDLITATRYDEKEQSRYYAIYAYNRVKCTPENPNTEETAVSSMYQQGTTKSTFRKGGKTTRELVSVCLEGKGIVSICNPWDGSEDVTNFIYEDGYMKGRVWIEEDEMLVFCLKEEEKTEQVSYLGSIAEQEPKSVETIHFHKLTLEELVKNSDDAIAFWDSHFEPKAVIAEETMITKPWNEIDESYHKLSGRGIYEGSFDIPEGAEKHRYILKLGNITDTFRIWVNGKEVSGTDQAFQKAEITDYVVPGANEIKVLVTSNLYNKVMGNGEADLSPLPIPYREKAYGIWEDKDHPIGVEIY